MQFHIDRRPKLEGLPSAAVVMLHVSRSWDLLITQRPLADAGLVHHLSQAMDLMRSTPGFGADPNVEDNSRLLIQCFDLVSDLALATKGSSSRHRIRPSRLTPSQAWFQRWQPTLPALLAACPSHTAMALKGVELGGRQASFVARRPNHRD
jgi:hypothetical protein